MSKVLILRGLPASGKSTFAKKNISQKPESWVRINKDSLRDMMNDGIFKKRITENRVIRARDSLLKVFLQLNLDILIDDTNFAAQHVKQIAKIASSLNASIAIKDFDVPLEECIRRDKERDNTVGEDVIRKMYKQYNLKNGFPKVNLAQFCVEANPYVPDVSKPKAVICDLDGTVAEMNNRGPFDFSKVLDDLPKQGVIDVVKAMELSGHKIIFLSGRDDICEDDTKAWLENYVPVDSSLLYMRKTSDNRKDSVIKGELFDRHIRHNYNVICAFDDRKQMIDFWQSIGVQTMDVSIGDNDF